MANTTTKQQLQKTLDEISEKISDLLDPVLTREEIIEGLQEADEMLNGSEDDTEEEEEEEEE